MSNVKQLVTQAIDEHGDAKQYTTPFRTTIERVRRGDIVAYLNKGADGEPEVEYLLEVLAKDHNEVSGAYTLSFPGGHFREAFEGLPLTVARRK